MTNPEPNVLIAVDLGPATARVVASGRELARLAGAHVWLMHVAEPEPDFVGLDAGPPSVRAQLAEVYHDEHVALQTLATGLRDAGLTTTALLVQGRAGEKILAELRRLEARYLVLGAHHRFAPAPFAVNVLHEVLRKAPCPVLVVPHPPRKGLGAVPHKSAPPEVT